MKLENDIKVITTEVRDALIQNFKNSDEDLLIVAHWVSLTGELDHYGVSINPDRPTVCWGFVPFNQGRDEEIEFGTFWIDREEGNPYSYGNCLSEIEYPGEVVFNGQALKFPMFHLDESWTPVRLSALMAKKGWRE